jgi:hypothetical protein
MYLCNYNTVSLFGNCTNLINICNDSDDASNMKTLCDCMIQTYCSDDIDTNRINFFIELGFASAICISAICMTYSCIMNHRKKTRTIQHVLPASNSNSNSSNSIEQTSLPKYNEINIESPPAYPSPPEYR